MPKNERGHAAVISYPDLLDLWEEMRYPHDCIAQVAYWTASRISEVLSLHGDSVRGDRLHIYQSKTKCYKNVPIFAGLAPVLEQLPSSGYWFPAGHQSTGKRPYLSTQAFEKDLRRAIDLMGWQRRGIRTHSFRRSMATHLHDRGEPHKKIMALTGHRSLDAFELYLDADASDLREVLDDLAGWGA